VKVSHVAPRVPFEHIKQARPVGQQAVMHVILL
jgi:hypothetical protein